MSDQQELPKYRCHKEVWALKISDIEIHDDGSASIHPSGVDLIAPINTGAGFSSRFKGDDSDMGYYVLYEGGYESWSPTKAFEDGYTRV